MLASYPSENSIVLSARNSIDDYEEDHRIAHGFEQSYIL